MSDRTTSRIAASLAPLVAAGLALSACGGSDDAAASRPTVTLEAGETSYATLPPATTVPPADAADETEESDPSGVQEYTIVAGDIGITIAEKFGVSLEDLENINGWSDAGRELPFPGSVIKIPAGATTQATSDDDTDEGESASSADDTEDGDEGETGETIPELGGNCGEGSYVIEAGDTSRFKVAEKFDVTVEDMDAANSGTNGYDAFYPGLKIVIPAKDDC